MLLSASKSQRSHELRPDVLVVVGGIEIRQTPSTSSSHSSLASSDFRRAVTVEGDRAVFSKIMHIVTSAVRRFSPSRSRLSVSFDGCRGSVHNEVQRRESGGYAPGGSRSPRRVCYDRLEPSTQSFLSIPEKQIARSDLYLFEIIQNAVDDSALNVRFQVTPKGLAVSHDGRRITTLSFAGFLVI